MTWSEIRAHFAAVHAQAGTTQQAIADRGGIAGQNTVSRLLANDKLGPSVEIFIRALEGLGKPVSEFFLELEQGEDEIRAFASGAAPLVSEPATPASLTDRLERLERAIETLGHSSVAHGAWSGPGVPAPPGDREDRPSHHGGSSISPGVVNHIHIGAFDRPQLEAIVQSAVEGIVTKFARGEVSAVGEGHGRVPTTEPAARRVDRRSAAEHA